MIVEVKTTLASMKTLTDDDGDDDDFPPFDATKSVVAHDESRFRYAQPAPA